MKTKVEALEGSQVKLTVTVDAKEIDERIGKTYKDFAYKYSFPGFRRGKAPRPVIDNALGDKAVAATVTDEVMNGLYPLAVDESGLYPTSKPAFEDEEALVKAGTPFVFSATLSVKPEFELSSYSPVEIELPPEHATEEEIAQQVEAFREHYFTYEDAGASAKIAEGGHADLAIEATDEAGAPVEALTAQSRLYSLGTGLFPAAFDKELTGMAAGQKKTFDIDFSDGQHTAGMSLPRAGKVTFTVEVKAVKEKSLPEVTDEWAKETCGFEGADDLRARIAESLEQQKAQMLPGLKENACLNVLSERLVGEAPEAMVEDSEAELIQSFFRQLQSQNMSFDGYLMQEGITSEQFKEDVKKQAADTVRQDLALDAWARHAGMEVTKADLVHEFANSGAEKPEELEAQWRARGQMHLLRQGLLRSRAASDVMDTAAVTELAAGGAAGKKGDAKAKAPSSKTAKAAGKPKAAKAAGKTEAAKEKKEGKAAGGAKEAKAAKA